MGIRRGDVYYNQIIPQEEEWEETLKRKDLIVWQIGRQNKNRDYSVDVFTIKAGKLKLSNTLDLSETKIQTAMSKKIMIKKQ